MVSYEKKLTANDIGNTGGHQAGICVPRANKELLSFFPFLDSKSVNPDTWLYCEDELGEIWRMRYIYYNGKMHNTSTRNEYRITCMTKFFMQWRAREGDTIVFTATAQKRHYKIKIEYTDSNIQKEASTPKLIVLRGWNKIC